MSDHIDYLQARMRADIVWKWLDAVDQDNLDLLDQWGVHPSRNTSPGSDSFSQNIVREPCQRHDGKRNTDIARTMESSPPSGILLRNGSIRMAGDNSKFFAYDVANGNHPKSLVPGFSTNVAHDVKSEAPSQLLLPGTITSEPTHHRVETPSIHQLQVPEKDGNNGSSKAMNNQVHPGRARASFPTGSLQSPAVIQVEVIDSLALNCQGARVVGGYQQNDLQSLPSTAEKSRRNTTAGDTALHRSNALKRPSNVRAMPELH